MDTSIVIKSKKWFQISNYITSVLGLILFGYILYQLFYVGSEDPAVIIYILATVSIIGIILIFLTIPVLHRYQIELNPDSITKVGLIKKEISYSDITQIVVRRGGIEIHGKSLFDRIIFGDLQNNFEEASKFLSNKLSDIDQIQFRGKQEYVDRFLSYSQTA